MCGKNICGIKTCGFVRLFCGFMEIICGINSKDLWNRNWGILVDLQLILNLLNMSKKPCLNCYVRDYLRGGDYLPVRAG